DRLPIAASGGTEDVIGYLDMVVAEVFGGLRPIADFRRIVADRAGREKSAEFHRVLASVEGVTGGRGRLPACGWCIHTTIPIGSENQRVQPSGYTVIVRRAAEGRDRT